MTNRTQSAEPGCDDAGWLPAMRRTFCLLLLALPGTTGCGDNSHSQDATAAASATAQATDRRVLGAEDEKRHLRLYTEEIQPGKLQLSFDNAPSFVRPLEMAPATRELELGRGNWLVLAAGAWSVPDVRCIFTAIHVLEQPDFNKENLKLGVRLFDDYQEIKTWYPEYDGSAESPLWLCYSHGKVVGTRSGVLTKEQIADLVRNSFAK